MLVPAEAYSLQVGIGSGTQVFRAIGPIADRRIISHVDFFWTFGVVDFLIVGMVLGTSAVADAAAMARGRPLFAGGRAANLNTSGLTIGTVAGDVGRFRVNVGVRVDGGSRFILLGLDTGGGTGTANVLVSVGMLHAPERVVVADAGAPVAG